MIRQVEQYHGVALARLVRSGRCPGVNVRADSDCRSAFVLDERVALYVKYSTSRLSPWSFGFQVDHQEEISRLRDEFEHAFITLVCGFDGVACLSAAEYQQVLDDDPRSGEWIKVSRRPRQKYWITGSDDRKGCRIGDKEYPEKIYATLREV